MLKNAKGFSGQTLERVKKGKSLSNAAVQVVIEAMQTCRSPKRLLQCGDGVVLQLIHFQQTGGSVQHIIVLPHTSRMQAQEGQHISAVKPPQPQLEMHCAGQINQAIPGGGRGCVVAVSVLNIKSAVVMLGSENMGSVWKLVAGRAMPLGCTSALDRAEGGVQVETPGLRRCLWCTWGQAGSEAMQMSNEEQHDPVFGRCSPQRVGDDREVQACGGKKPQAGTTPTASIVICGAKALHNVRPGRTGHCVLCCYSPGGQQIWLPVSSLAESDKTAWQNLLVAGASCSGQTAGVTSRLPRRSGRRTLRRSRRAGLLRSRAPGAQGTSMLARTAHRTPAARRSRWGRG